MIKHTFFCDYAGCSASAPSIATHAAVLPGDWGVVAFTARTDDKQEACAEGHLCPEHAEVIGKQLGGSWSVSAKTVKKAPKRFSR